jgi:predicted transcriptional regulator
MSGAFLSYTQIQEYLQLLISRGLIMQEEGTQLYKLTEKGLHFIRSYEQISDILAINGGKSSHN